MLEPIPRTERPIELASAVAIEFGDWGEGLDRLVEQLRAAGTPCAIDGGTGFSPSATPAMTVVGRPETLYSNAFVVEGIPAAIHHYRLRGLMDGPRWAELRRVWPHWNPSRTGDLLSFYPPPTELAPGVGLAHQRNVAWAYLDKLADQPMSTIIPALLRRTFEQHCCGRGLVHWTQTSLGGTKTRRTNWWFFPRGLVPDDKLRVENWAGKLVPIKLIGARTYRGQPFNAHLAVSPFLEQMEPRVYLLFLRLSVRPFEASGEPCEPGAVGARVKAATRSWTNSDLLARLRVFMGFLSDADGAIRLGPADQARIWLRPLGGEIDRTLDEAQLARLGAEPASGELESDLEQS